MKSLPTAWLITPQAPDCTWSGYDAIEPQDLVIAIDGGLLRCMELRLKVDYLCGDMDSIAEGWQQQTHQTGCGVLIPIKMRQIPNWQFNA